MKIRLEALVALFILGVFGIAAMVIVATVQAHEVHVPRQPINSMPDIAQCDQPLWERIRNGCPDDV